MKCCRNTIKGEPCKGEEGLRWINGVCYCHIHAPDGLYQENLKAKHIASRDQKKQEHQDAWQRAMQRMARKRKL